MAPKRQCARNAYFFFVQEKLPELRQRGLAVTGVRDAIPHCSDDWAMLSEEQKEKYAEMAHQWKTKKSQVVSEKPPSPVPEYLPVQSKEKVTPTKPYGETDKVLLETIFYFMNIFSHGELPSHCSQRFLPCEIGCIKYSLKDGIIANFHRFIDPGEVPRGFRFHCQAAGDASHRIPISGFEHATANHIVLRELYSFIQPRWGTWPPVYCKSVDQFRLNWCLRYMAEEAGTVNNFELLSVEDLVVELYYQKLQKEPSKTWVCNILDTCLWDYSSNTRCRWHEENDILFCALATCKKIAYCISNSLASMYDIQLTASHLPLHEKNSQNTVNPKMVILDAGRFQKVRTQYSKNESLRSLGLGGDCNGDGPQDKAAAQQLPNVLVDEYEEASLRAGQFDQLLTVAQAQDTMATAASHLGKLSFAPEDVGCCVNSNMGTVFKVGFTLNMEEKTAQRELKSVFRTKQMDPSPYMPQGPYFIHC